MYESTTADGPVRVNWPTTMPAPPAAHGVLVTSMVPVVSTILVDVEPVGLRVPKSTVGWHFRSLHSGPHAHLGSLHLTLLGSHMCPGSQPGKLAHCGSAQSMRPSLLSSMQLLQISVPRMWQRGSPTHSGSMQLLGSAQRSPFMSPMSGLRMSIVQLGSNWQKEQ